MTVFFSDIQNFTNLSEQLAPNAVVRLLNHYISADVRNRYATITG